MHPRPHTEISAPSKRRKTYTIRKQREAWSDEEHQKFLEALEKFGRDWKQIEAYVGTKTLIQIRSHAQKHFEKLERKGDSSAIPPPKPKRTRQENSAGSSSDTLMIPWITTPDALSERPYLSTPTAFEEWMKSNGFLPDQPPPGIDTAQLSELHKHQREYLHDAIKNIEKALSQEKEAEDHPDWSKIYSYLGSLFDTDTIGRDASRLASLGPAERQIIHLLMHNLVTTLSDDFFGDQYRLLLRDFQQQQKHVREQWQLQSQPAQTQQREQEQEEDQDQEQEEELLEVRRKRKRPRKSSEKVEEEMDIEEETPTTVPASDRSRKSATVTTTISPSVSDSNDSGKNSPKSPLLEGNTSVQVPPSSPIPPTVSPTQVQISAPTIPVSPSQSPQTPNRVMHGSVGPLPGVSATTRTTVPMSIPNSTLLPPTIVSSTRINQLQMQSRQPGNLPPIGVTTQRTATSGSSPLFTYTSPHSVFVPNASGISPPSQTQSVWPLTSANPSILAQFRVPLQPLLPIPQSNQPASLQQTLQSSPSMLPNQDQHSPQKKESHSPLDSN